MTKYPIYKQDFVKKKMLGKNPVFCGVQNDFSLPFLLPFLPTGVPYMYTMYYVTPASNLSPVLYDKNKDVENLCIMRDGGGIYDLEMRGRKKKIN